MVVSTQDNRMSVFPQLQQLSFQITQSGSCYCFCHCRANLSSVTGIRHHWNTGPQEANLSAWFWWSPATKGFTKRKDLLWPSFLFQMIPWESRCSILQTVPQTQPQGKTTLGKVPYNYTKRSEQVLYSLCLKSGVPNAVIQSASSLVSH
jgi:hypothetical protein